MVEFYVNEKFITLDLSTLPQKGMVGDNTGYYAHFNFDSEWDGKAKTAVFINGNEHQKQLLVDDACEFPKEVLKSGFVEVGVFAGNLTASTGTKVPIYASILQKVGLPANPTPDIYVQLLERLSNLEAAQAGIVTIRKWDESDLEGGEA